MSTLSLNMLPTYFCQNLGLQSLLKSTPNLHSAPTELGDFWWYEYLYQENFCKINGAKRPSGRSGAEFQLFLLEKNQHKGCQKVNYDLLLSTPVHARC